MRLGDNRSTGYVRNSYKSKLKCLNCGKEISEENAKDMYSRRFCSEHCKEEYLGPSY